MHEELIASRLAIPEVAARFEAQFTKGDGCWIWHGVRSKSNYGRFCLGGDDKISSINAQRVAWIYAFGVFDGSLFVCHTCDNPPCVNPAHLFLGTNEDNIHDKVRKGRARGGSLCGERNASAKITAEIAARIRERGAAGERQRDIASSYGLRQQHVSEILRGLYW